MIPVTMFMGYKGVNNPQSMSLEECLENFKSGQWVELVNKVRDTQNEDERKRLKSTYPTITFSGEFSARRDEALVRHNGIIALDFDDLDNPDQWKKILVMDKYVLALFSSVSGTGLKMLVRINSMKHRESFWGLQKYFMNNYGLSIDPQSIVLSQAHVITYDPELYFNYATPVFSDLVIENRIPQKELREFVFEENDFSEIIKTIVSSKKNLVDDYQDWFRIGCSIASQFGFNGYEYFEAVSMQSRKYKRNNCIKQYRYCCRDYAKHGVTIATFYWYCQQQGIQTMSNTTRDLYNRIAGGKSANVTKEKIIEILTEEKISVKPEVVERMYNQASALDYGGDTTIHFIISFIKANHKLRRNVIKRKIENNGVIMEDIDVNGIYIDMSKIRPLNKNLLLNYLESPNIQDYNPIQEWFNVAAHNLPEYEQDNNSSFDTPLLNSICKTLKNDNPEYTKFFVKKWLVSVVASAYGTPSPLILVLVGKQNTGKTEWLRRILPLQLREYYAESKLDAGKDDELLSAEMLIISDDEFGGKNKYESRKIKEWTSKNEISLRAPYGRYNITVKRLAALCGTTNEEGILSDYTGNRRIIPIPVDSIDIESYNSINKEMLWREIAKTYSTGFDWRVGKVSISYLNINSDQYQIVRFEDDLVTKYFEKVGWDDCETFMTSTDIKLELDALIPKEKVTIDQIGKSLKKAGFIQKSKWILGNVKKMWAVVRINRTL